MMWYGWLFTVGALGASFRLDLEQLRGTCPLNNLTHLCRDSLDERTCSCDYRCLLYDDCCADALALRRYGGRDSPTAWTCREVEEHGHVLMKMGCPKEAEAHLRSGCEGTGPVQGLDPYALLPVTNRKTGVTYVNVYCAACQRENPDSLTVWNPTLRVQGLREDGEPVDVSYVRQRLAYDAAAKRWFVAVPSNGVPVEHEVTLVPNAPSGFRGRRCAPSLATRCPADWPDRQESLKCASYQAVTYSVVTDRGYRNPDCASCHGAPREELTCRPFPKPKTLIERRRYGGFANLLDFSGGGKVGKKDCEPGTLYDPFNDVCKRIVCLFGRVLVKDKCVPK